MKKRMTLLGVALVLMLSGCVYQSSKPITEDAPETHTSITPDTPVQKEITQDVDAHKTVTHKGHRHAHPGSTESDKLSEESQHAKHRLEQGKKLHGILSGNVEDKTTHHTKAIRKSKSEKIFIFKLKAPFETTARGFTPMVMISLVNAHGRAVSRFGKFLQIGENAPMTIHVYESGPFYIDYISSNILSVFKRPLDFTKGKDKEHLTKIAGHPMPGLGPIYLAPGEATAEYTIDIGMHEPKRATNDGVYSVNGVHIIFEGAAIY